VLYVRLSFGFSSRVRFGFAPVYQATSGHSDCPIPFSAVV
jgi:hypothetical protein